MKKLIAFTKKEWKRYCNEQSAITKANVSGAYKAGVAYGQKDVDILVSALATALKAQSTDTASVDLEDPYFIGKHTHGVLRSLKQTTVHIYPKSLLPQELIE